MTTTQYRVDWARNKYKTDPVYRRKRLDAAMAHVKRNKARYNLVQKKRQQDRYKTDIEFTLGRICSCRIFRSLKSQHAIQLYDLKTLMGCSFPELKKYLQAKFKPGMSWKKWNFQLDHIRAITSFNLKKGSEQKKAFNYKNLQPLFVGEHIEKSARYLNRLENRVMVLKRQNKELRKVVHGTIKASPRS